MLTMTIKLKMPTESQNNTHKREEKCYPTKELKAEIRAYCKTNKISMSKFMVMLIRQFLKTRKA